MNQKISLSEVAMIALATILVIFGVTSIVVTESLEPDNISPTSVETSKP